MARPRRTRGCFGGKHHSTVIHSIKKIDLLRQRDGDFNNLVNNLSESLK
jgi:chromosomal replication initiator protein